MPIALLVLGALAGFFGARTVPDRPPSDVQDVADGITVIIDRWKEALWEYIGRMREVMPGPCDIFTQRDPDTGELVSLVTICKGAPGEFSFGFCQIDRSKIVEVQLPS